MDPSAYLAEDESAKHVATDSGSASRIGLRRTRSDRFLIHALLWGAVYCTTVVSISAASDSMAGEFPLIVVGFGIVAFVVSAPLFVVVGVVARSNAALWIAMIAGISAVLTQRGFTTTIGHRFAVQLIIVGIAAVIAVTWSLAIRRWVQRSLTRRIRAGAAVLGMVLLAALASQFATTFGRHNGFGAPEDLTQDQLRTALASNDMQQHHEAGWYLAQNEPVLLAQFAVGDDKAAARNAVRAIWRFEVMPAIAELQRLAREGVDAEVRDRAVSALRQVEEQMERKG